MSEQAVKIFEALSAVDEELLERCDQAGKEKNGAVYRLYQRYGRAMTACICLIVVGAAAWGGYRLATGGFYGAGRSDANGAPAEQYQTTQSMAAADCAMDGGYPTDGQEEEYMVEGAEPAAGAVRDDLEPAGTPAAGSTLSAGESAELGTDKIQTESQPVSNVPAATQKENAEQQTMGDTQSQMSVEDLDRLKESEAMLQDGREAIPWKDACVIEPFNRYLPAVLPAGYEAFSARRSALPEQWDNLIFKWSDGEHIFCLNMTQGEVVTREELEQRDGLHEYLAADFQKELIPQLQPMDEAISFTLYYADGMRIDFEGYVTADEMWSVVESVNK